MFFGGFDDCFALVVSDKRYPVTATAFHLIGKETERGWEQSEDISTLIAFACALRKK
jgi:hypothetical protein